MEKILTVKVAAYNVEKYIRQCLDPFTNEKYRDEIQVIIVNNQCEDDTLKIIKEYEEKLPNVFQVITQSNKGYASTFNKGFEFAIGKYFTHLDGDDWFEEEELCRFISILKSCDSDLVVSNVRGVFDKEKQTKEFRFNNVVSCHEYLFDEVYSTSKQNVGSHAITVKTSILKDNKIVVHEGYFIPEVEYELLIVPYIKTIMFTGEFLYNYRTGYAEQASNYNNIKSKCDDIYKSVMVFLDWMDTLQNISKSKYNYLVNRTANCVNVIFYLMLFQKISIKNWKNINCILRKIKERNNDIYIKTTILAKLSYWGTPLSYVVMAYVYRYYKKRKKFNF